MVGVREGLTVVVAQRERAHDVAVLLRDFNAEFDTASPAIGILTERFQRLLERDDVLVCIADLNQSAVGFAFLTLRPSPYYETPVAMLEELYVRPALRGQGIGTAIMDVVEAELHGRGVEEIQNQCRRDGRRRLSILLSPVDSSPTVRGDSRCYSLAFSCYFPSSAET
ncbi:GNAT family N-acetyltransferase [Corynebacterium axilliensis]|uniref:GNAT family N-acetyltransferase n=1 Tax=Corynebacterium sp. YSMAA5_1_F9 TaxID=3383591 RepID=UPI0038D015F7